MKKFTLNVLMLFGAVLGVVAQTTIYQQNFSGTSLPVGWQNVDQTGNSAGTWTRKTSAHSFASSSASNGFYIFDSDALGNDNKAENADLISAAINCSAYSHVALQFEQYFQQYNASSGTVFVSTDGNNFTQVYSVNATSDNPELVTLDITSYAANQATVYIKFNYSGNYDYWWAIDDIKVFEPAALDVAVTTLELPRFVGLSSQFVSGTLTNKGYTPITSVDLTYAVNGGTAVSQSLTGINIPSFGTYAFQFSQPIAMSSPQKYAVVVNAIGPNAGTDANTSDNVSNKDVVALSALPQKNVLLEEFTTAPCQYCPDGAVVVEEIVAAHSTWCIPVAIHAGFGTDGMTTTEASALAAAFANGAPTAPVDRIFWPGEEAVAISRNIWEDKCIESHNRITPIAVTATSSYNSNTRELSVSVTARTFGALTGDYRINAYLVEDSVTGTGSGYNQVNAYNNASGHPYQGKGNPIVGFIHRNVERKALGGTWGASGVIPTTTADLGEYTKDFTYTIPAANNADRCHVIAFVHEYNSVAKSGKNEVFNAVALPLNGSVTQTATPSVFNSIADVSSINSMTVYPNPAKDILNVEMNINSDAKLSFEVFNMIGQNVYTVSANQFAKGGNQIQINTSNFDNGVYFVSVKEEGKTASTVKFVINR